MDDSGTVIRDWTPGEVHQAICNDFETAWDAVAAISNDGRPRLGRGNFMFANQAMILLEWACRLCAGDASGTPLQALSRALDAAQPAYFTPLPTTIKAQAAGRVNLPIPPQQMRPGHSPLLWLLFDLVRNGLAHQYQQIVLHLSDGAVYIRLGGPTFEHTIEHARTHARQDHLSFERTDETVGLIIRPEQLFFDFQNAIDGSGILSMNLQPRVLKRPDPYGQYLGLTGANLQTALNKARHGIVIHVTPPWANYAPTDSRNFWTPEP